MDAVPSAKAGWSCTRTRLLSGWFHKTVGSRCVPARLPFWDASGASVLPDQRHPTSFIPQSKISRSALSCYRESYCARPLRFERAQIEEIAKASSEIR
jgi:hypothetical protein